MLRGVVVLLALQGALALSQIKGRYHDSLPFSTCSFTRVDSTHPATYVTLKDNLVFALRPSTSLMHMRIMAQNTLYKATVHGTTVKLNRCSSEGQEDICFSLDEKATKGKDLLTPNQWNFVTVSLAADQLKVDINSQVDVMVMTMPDSSDGPYTSKVSIMAPDPTAKTRLSYSVDVNIKCNDTFTPELQTVNPEQNPVSTTNVPITTVKVPIPEPPHKNCPVYHVEHEHSTPNFTLNDELTLSIWPSHSMVYLRILIDDTLFKVNVKQMMMELMQCSSDGESCRTIQHEGSKSQDFLHPNTWNMIHISLKNNKITVDINMRANVTGINMPASSGGTNSGVVFIVADLNQKIAEQAYYLALVNIACDDISTTEVQEVTPSVPVTDVASDNPLVSQNSITDSATEEISQPVGIIVGVLFAILAVVAIAIAISTYKKKRSVSINQHTPLNDQQQQIKE
ncbi:uncharacterized protein LOC121874335 [Homarus americanus]|uniref:uncharacterized protein LOC121874335 n=1 Tax=Homarus americanus TaxID=6706 RepID=UPI001C47D489|nr:uncharacterized protein LOC121874335 [Homarus americanus]